IFQEQFCRTRFDEVHLLNSWGVSFQKEFLQMGFVHACMTRSHNPWILMSATVHEGAPFNICEFLGLDDTNFHLIQCSFTHPDVQMLFCDLVSPISGDLFPELGWILLTDGHPSIIFAKDYGLGSRIYAYLLQNSMSNNPNLIHIYNSLN
ncbi:hypothetical protein C8R44DRAFT_535965, partial [Mycena epipterygia]